MQRYSVGFLVVLVSWLVSAMSLADKGINLDEDRNKFQAFFMNKFPQLNLESFVDGVYSIDEAAREQWLEIEDFPPYEFAVERGEKLFNAAFKNGSSYGECFSDGGLGIRQNYPYFDVGRKQVITLELAINECRSANGEPLFDYMKGDIAAISAYMASSSQREEIQISVPNEDALAAYEAGKKFFYSRRGQLNFSCAQCHMQNAGQRFRAELTSPALGHTTHFPVYRAKWGEVGTLHRRYAGCNKQVRAKPFAAQSEEYRNLEYFQSVMNIGLSINGPGTRR